MKRLACHARLKQFKARISGTVALDHDFISWLFRHSAWLITRFRVRASDHTVYELIRQHKYIGAIVEYGEIVWIPATKKVGPALG